MHSFCLWFWTGGLFSVCFLQFFCSTYNVYVSLFFCRNEFLKRACARSRSRNCCGFQYFNWMLSRNGFVLQPKWGIKKKELISTSSENDNYDIFWVNTLSYRLNIICCHRWHMYMPIENGVLACVLCSACVIVRSYIANTVEWHVIE